MRHTKIIATIGPASASREVLDALVTAGVDVFRLNFSHGTHASHAESFARIREIASHAGRHVGIMQDLSGPKIRTGPLAGDRPLPLKEGESLVLGEGNAPSQPGRIFTPYAELVRSAQPGDRLLLDDGRIELKVVGRQRGGPRSRRGAWRRARWPQGHQRAGRRPAAIGADRQGRRRSAVRPPPRRGLRGLELRADGR